jgi:hypothetical protein
VKWLWGEESRFLTVILRIIVLVFLVFLANALLGLGLLGWAGLQLGLGGLALRSSALGLGRRWGSIVLLVVGLTILALSVHSSNLLSSQKSTTGSTWAAHGVIVSRLVQVRFATLGCETESVLQLLSCKSALQDSVELFGIDVERGFLGLRSSYKLGRLLVLWWRCHLRRD